MKHRDRHREFWIEELKGYGILQGPNGEALADLEYYDLRAYVVKAQLQRDLETKASPWF
ncbi:hypothetical protein [Planomicrobium sp. CPCC 101079]|uniref:hypothetical protein n=1 Tax=Planomicrobium sp. CPCC 101079 TaxID=2599618 RepID=UPI0016476957|nr:hypothetical protein [Planomicrobium sp. CPCC 101079]